MYKVRIIQLASIFGLALFIVSVCAFVSEADAINDSVVVDGVTYSLKESGEGDYAIVTAVNSDLTEVSIPSSITDSGKSFEVRSIDANAFQDSSSDDKKNRNLLNLTIQANNNFRLEPNQFSSCVSLTTVVLGTGIAEISDNAFVGCTNLEEVTLPSTIISIGNSSFSGCTKLTTINQVNGLKIIGESAFKNCSGLTGFNFGSNLETISTDAFRGCTGLIEIELPNSVVTLGSSAFGGCTSLESISLGTNLGEIGSKAFVDTKITSLSIPASTTSLGLTNLRQDSPFPSTMVSLSIDNGNTKYACENNMVLDKETGVILYAFKITGEVTISNNIGSQAFQGLGLTKLIISEGVTTIGDGSFSRNSNLTEVTLPSSVTSIGEAAFDSCTALNKLTLADGLTVIGGFSGCTGLTNVTLPNSIVEIKNQAFKGCTNLNTSLPTHLESIGNEAFRDCKALPCPTLPATLKEIGSYAFYSATKVKFKNLTLGADTEIKLGEYAINLSGATGIALTLNKVTCDDEYCYGKLFYNAKNCTVALGPDFKLWEWKNGLGISLDGKTVYMKEPGSFGDVVIPASVERIIGKGFQSYANNSTTWKLTCEDPNSTIVLDSGVADQTTCGVFYKSQYLTDVSLPNIVVNEGLTFYNCTRLVNFAATSISALPQRTFELSKVVELNLNGCSYIVGPMDASGSSTMMLIEIPTSLESASFAGGSGYTFYDASGTLISFNQNGNPLSNTTQASLIAGKTFYSQNHDKMFYEVPANEIILVTEKSTGNTYQKIAKADRYDGIAGSGQVYRIADGKALLTLHIGDELIYVAVDKGAVSDLAIPTKIGHNFEGWFTDSEYSSSFDTSAAINADQVLYAKFTIVQYTITFDTAGGSEIAAITLDYGSDVTAPDAPTRTGYTFTGWDAEVPAKMPASSMTLKASWKINQYTITFDTAGGSEIAAITQDYDSDVTAPDAPTRTGYTFTGWDAEVPAKMPVDGMTLTAVWAIAATVDENGKSVVALDSEISSFIPAAETKEITVEIRENTTVKVENASDLIGKTVVSKVETVSNSTDVVGTAYEFTFTADGTQYNGLIQVTLPYTKEAGKEPVVYYWNGSESTKMNVVSSTDTSVTFETDHNSMYVVASEVPSKDEGASFLLYFGIVVIAGICAAMLVGFNFYRKKA